MSFLKTVAVPDRGIDYSLRPHAIDPRAWFSLNGARTRNGTARSFQGWNSIASPPLAEPILGIFEFFQGLTLSRYHVIGISNKVFSFDIVAGTLTDITGAAVLNATPTNPWAGCTFMDAVHMVSLETDGIHKWNGTGTLVQIPESPSFAFINTINDYLVGFYERLGTEHYPYSFRWAAEGTDDQWIASETVDAGEFDISDTPDKAVALHRLGDDLVAYKEHTIVPVTFIGGNEIFGRRAAVSGAGLLGPYALMAAGDRHIFMGHETFYSYTGGNVVDDSIGDSVRDLVYREINKSMAYQCRAAYIRDSLEMVFFYPSILNTTGVGCDRAVIYNLKDGTWAGPMSIIDFITFCQLFNDKILYKEEIFGTKAGKIMGHGSSYTEDGVPQLRVMESGDHNLQTDATNEQGNKIFFPLSTVFQVNVVNLDVEDLGSPTANFFIGSRLDLNDPIVWQGPFPIVGGPSQGICVPVRSTGRWFRIKIETNINAEFALLGYQFEFEYVGNR